MLATTIGVGVSRRKRSGAGIGTISREGSYRPASPWLLPWRRGRRTFRGMAMLRSAPRLVAVLGPTNTGKTHLAIERMLDHTSGMIGFPLRLLARENYDRVVKLCGARAVALITGEEKIV